jgi:hypothetical protein
VGGSWGFELEEIQKLIRESKQIGKRQREPVEEKEEKRLAERGQYVEY